MALPSRRDFLLGVGAMALSPHTIDPPLVSTEDLKFLTELAARTIQVATKNDSRAKLGFPVITPGGAYPAMWIRDFSMGLGCGLIPFETGLNHFRLIAQAQNGSSPRDLRGEAEIPAFSIPDHVNYDGGAVFYPGTYSSGDDQGGEPWGYFPPFDDIFEFVHIAYLLWKSSGETLFLSEKVGEHNLYTRLKLAFDSVPADVDTGLVSTAAGRRAVGFGFCDGIYFTGQLLFASLLRLRALRELAEIAHEMGDEPRTLECRAAIGPLLSNILPTFEIGGWLKATTGIGQQADAWGTIFALYTDSVPANQRSRMIRVIAESVRSGRLTYLGAVRHVPTDRDYSADSTWQKTIGEGRNRYQNGAYWHVPTGWLATLLWEEDQPLARKLVAEMVQHFREEDFRKGGNYGAPWECLHGEQNYRQNPVYMASVTLPLEALTKWKRDQRLKR